MRQAIQSASAHLRAGRGKAIQLLVLGWLCSGCGGSAARTEVDYNPDVDFKRFGTYSWRDGTPSPNSLIDQRIIDSVDRELRKKGLREVARGGDLRVTYHVSFDRKLEVYSWDYLAGPYWSSTWARRTEVRAIPEGKLVVDLIDGRHNQIVWRGVAADELTASETDMESRISYVTAELFEDYPPHR
ncbi:MAG: DUF4136 domain-containing protein [Longimicrobiales bacterium]